MSLPVVFVGGNKGGVGKSLASMALIDYWLSQNPAKPVFLVDTDTSNPDVAHAYGKTVPHYLPNITKRDGWIDLVDKLDEEDQRKSSIVVNLASQSNQYWEQYGSILLKGLQAMKRPAICMWLINRQKDSLELLAEFREKAAGVKIHVVRNAYFGEEQKFELYNGNEIRKEIEGAGGKSVTFPELADRITDRLYTKRMTVAEAGGKGMLLGSQAEVNRWREECAEVFAQMGV
jgi:hypothetical protein